MLIKILWILSSRALLALAWTNTWGDNSFLENFAYLDTSPSVYKDTGLDYVPDISKIITEVRANASYIVKLPCIGCPFRLRERGMVYGYFESPPRDSALLLNFTVNAETRNLQLYSRDLWPQTALQEFRGVQAYQPPIWLYEGTLQNMIRISMFDTEFEGIGTAYASFNLNWNMEYLSKDDDGIETILFDIVSIEYHGLYPLDSPAQKVVQLRIQRTSRGKLQIQSIALIDRIEAARAKALARKAASRSTNVVIFRNAEWDQYGKIGTWDHFWAYLPWWLDETVAEWFPIWGLALAISPFLCCYRWVRRRRARAIMAAERTWKSIY